jgi:hypothetical protein
VANWLKGFFGGSKDSQPQTTHPVFDDPSQRKAWSEAFLTERGIPINAHLPLTENAQETELRKPGEIADRILALTAVAIKGGGVEPEFVAKFISERNVRELFSPREMAFIDTASPDHRTRAQFSWQYECIWVLLWALKHIGPTLNFPDRICDVPRLAAIVRDTPRLDTLGTFPAGVVLTELDLHYRYHWAVRQSHIDGGPEPGGLNGGVVMERHRALNWLVRYMDADWDDVSTDT